jgi:hypothetical protein
VVAASLNKLHVKDQVAMEEDRGVGGVGLRILRVLFHERLDILRALFHGRFCVALVLLSGEPTFPQSDPVLKWSSKRQSSFSCYRN